MEKELQPSQRAGAPPIPPETCPAIPEQWRCPNCNVRFSRVDNVDDRQSTPACATPNPDSRVEKLEAIERDFRWRANQCRTNADAFDPVAAAVWDLAADAVRDKHDAL